MIFISMMRLKRYFHNIGRSFWLGLALMAAAPLVVLSVWQQDTGYANNGDFVRNAESIFSHPQGFSVLYVPEGHPDRESMFFKNWLDRWVVSSDGLKWRLAREASIYKLYLTAQVRLTSFFDGGEEVYSMARGAWLSRAILYGALAFCAWRISAFLPGWILVGLVVALAWLYLESSWVAYLNSFYEEQVAILLLPLLAFAVALYMYGDGKGWVWVIFVTALLIGWSKTAYFYMPALVLIFFALVGFRPFWCVFVLAIVIQLIAIRPVIHGEYKQINPYHSVYFGALVTLSEQDLDDLSDMGGKPLIRECVGVAVFSPGGEKCLRDAQIRRGDVFHVLVEKPYVLWRMLRRAVREGQEIDLTYLGKTKSGEGSVSSWPVFNGWRFLFLHCAQYVSLALLFLSVTVLICFGFSESPPLLVSGVFLLIFGWSQYFAALGDGFYELTKHLSIGNYALALGSLFVLFGLMGISMNALRRALRSVST